MTTEVKVVFAGVDQVGDVLNKVQSKMKAAFDKMKAASKAVGQGFEIGTKALAALGQAFEFAGEKAKALGRADVSTNIEKMNKAFDTLTNTLITAEVGGRDFLQWMGDAAEGATNAANVISILSIKFQQMTGSITDQEAAAKAYALVNQEVVLSTEQLAQAQIDLADPMDESNRLMRDQANAAEHAAAMQDVQKAAADKLAFSMGELNKQTIFEAASAGLSAEAKFELAKSMGFVDEKAAAAWEALQKLKDEYDKNRDGSIDAAEAADGYTAAVIRLDQAASGALERLRAITAEMNAQTGGIGGRHGGEITDVPGGATGLHMVAPPGHANDSFFVRASSGEPIDIWRSQADRAAAMGGGGGGDISITVNVSQMPANVDARGMADMLSTQIARKVRALKNSHAQTIGQ